MDPNETLKRIREIARADYNTEAEELEAFGEMTDLVLELDRWIMSGGFLPSTWADKVTVRPSVIESSDPWQSPATALKGDEPF
jgi:hypothetical protein